MKNTEGGLVEAGLPEISGDLGSMGTELNYGQNYTGCFYSTNSKSYGNRASYSDWDNSNICFSASKSNPIYGKSTTVQPPAYIVYAWRRAS